MEYAIEALRGGHCSLFMVERCNLEKLLENIENKYPELEVISITPEVEWRKQKPRSSEGGEMASLNITT